MIVLDTHVWLWWILTPERLSDRASNAIDEAHQIGLSAYSVYELARAHASGRVELDRADWIDRAVHVDPRMMSLPITNEIAGRAVALLQRGLAGDPGDQLILATAETASAQLISADKRLRKFAPDLVVW